MLYTLMQIRGPICGKGLMLMLAPLQVRQMEQLQQKEVS
jgi:hypothetical protein